MREAGHELMRKREQQEGRDPVSSLPEELEELAASMGLPRFRGRQIFAWIHGRAVCDPEKMTDLPAELRRNLSQKGLRWPASTGEVLRSQDGTRKIRVRLEDGSAVETVLIPEEDKLTQCVSTQVGCAVRCAFCRSGRQGLKRNLTAAEIVAQVHLARRLLGPDEKLRNIVLMGVGEPLHNADEVIRALELFYHQSGLDFSTRRVTVSTVGVVRGIDRLAEAFGGQAALAVSLHASDEQTRRRLVPKAKDSLDEIAAALARYPLPKRRRFTIEYVLVGGINDSVAAAKKLAKLLSRIPVKVNLLPLNPHDLTELKPPEERDVLAFQQALVDKGVSAFLRKKRGADIGAACGQLLAMGKE